ncbi:MAG: hypothetical protein B7Y05_21745 [Polynucleobacter sp. 24-46-87]|uniref:TorF family putative porin n=1 Tax=Polynucleobacter sp. es-EL-1 TaxID=1855652 RepID=UPI000BDA6570|nr:TorF family putative porin [Polynucleobacter sp. es-EL-1]OYY54694.1 MAG: hypothetical protein B7Y55_07825 [Polynucleobacter sp. 35-46-207]OZA05823.1 MAG: hypothetical protein B7Y05_21745 [Polynucleobacter sp. 24-46-87]OZB43214.1 MAG: hypothetical protein B7X60_10240 [Polynucleobacter sp. 39-45-136]QWE10480.1 hypothetical protein FD974_09105 [Polynucleobacter sp. es-EL-1]
MKTIQKTAIALAASGLFATAAFAADTPTNPEDAGSPISANVTVVNDYRYRGITQSNYQPAIQGGFDYAHESGFYIGNWNSSISWIGDQNSTASGAGNNVSSNIEMDFYGGFKKELIAPGFASDFGVLQYYYPTKGFNSTFMQNPNSTELYAAQNFTLGPLTGFVKLSYAVTTLFGIPNSAGSMYPDLTLNYDTGFWGLSANGHIGYQYVAGQPFTTTGYSGAQNNISYTDWKLGMTKDFGGGLSAQVSYISTNANPVWYSTGGNQSTWSGRGGANFSLTKTF